MYSREVVVNIMRAWLGARKGDPRHKTIIDTYNSIKPLPRAHKVSYSEPWCAATVSAAFHKAGYDIIFPSECSCNQMIAKAKNMLIWEERDDYIPKPGDCIMYDWDDTGSGDNKGVAEHVGMVETVSGGKITVIEGNKGSKSEVARRVIAVNGKYIRGFVLPAFADEVKKVHTTRDVTIWSAPEKIDANRERTVPEGYEITVYEPEFTANGERWYKTIKGKYVLAKYCL